MDCYKLVQEIPSFDEFDSSSRVDQKMAAVACMTMILDALDEDDRPPDGWEVQNLSCAIGFIGADVHRMAISYARRVLTPLDDRPSLCLIEVSDLVTVNQLRDALARATAPLHPAVE